MAKTAKPLETKPKRLGLQTGGQIRASNADAYRLKAAAEGKGISELAGEILNDVLECMVATRLDWSAYRVTLRGFAEMREARMRNAAAESVKDWLYRVYEATPPDQRGAFRSIAAGIKFKEPPPNEFDEGEGAIPKAADESVRGKP